jgi:tetratricopeptide (TPR) repeat protein
VSKNLILITTKDKSERVVKLRELTAQAEGALGFLNAVTLDIMNTLGIEIDDKSGTNSAAQIEAKEILERTLEGQEKVYEDEHEDMMMTVMNLGNIYFGTKEYEKALKFYMRALKGQQNTLGEHHTSSLTSCMNIANVLNDGMRDYQKAKVFYNSALDGFEKQLGKDHRFTVVTANKYKNCLLKLMDFVGFWALEKRCGVAMGGGRMRSDERSDELEYVFYHVFNKHGFNFVF